eukprot:scaffold22713_cov139-Cylindrotheca_fusiformis.AAC.14
MTNTTIFTQDGNSERSAQRSYPTMSSSDPPPQLARMQYNLDDDSSTSSLEIIPPKASDGGRNSISQSKPKATHTDSLLQTQKIASMMGSSDSEDDLLLGSRPIFSTASKRNVNNRTVTMKDNSSNNNNTARPEETKQEARLRKRREAEARKEAEKMARAKKREDEKAEREQAKLEEKGKRKREQEEFHQSSGKYAHQEIAVLMDRALLCNEAFNLTEALQGDFLLHPINDSIIPKAIQWIRKDYLQGGAKDALEMLKQGALDQFEHPSYLLLVLEPADFIPLLKRDGHDVDDDYPRLEAYLADLKTRWQRQWKTSKEPSRILFLLYQIPKALDLKWLKHRKSKRPDGRSPPTEFELNDAIQWLLVQFQVECIHCPNIEILQTNVHKLTRGICEARYTNKVTELQCIKKIKQSTNGSRPIDRARDVWLRQLQQVPRISEAVAMKLVQHYPTMQSLFQAYQHGDNITNSGLVEGILSDRTRQSKLSHSLYRIMMSQDPTEMIS